MSGAAPLEVELKLLLSPEHFGRLQRHLRLHAAQPGERPATRRVHSVYWDTDDLALHRDGLALRVRRAEAGHLQTVKTAGDRHAGLFVRVEDEVGIDGASPEPERIGDDALRERVLAVTEGRELAAVVETDLRCSKRVLRQGDSVVEASLDVGEVRTARGTSPLCELELELLEGDRADLFDLALRLHEAVPLLPAVVDKPSRGYRMLTGEVPAPVRSDRVEMAHDASLEDAAIAILGSCLGQIVANRDVAFEGLDPEGVHQMRVGVRRLRSALGALKTALPEGRTRVLQGDLRWLARTLGEARDIDVFVTEMLEPVLLTAPDRCSLKRLRDEAGALREDANLGVRRALESPRYGALVLQLGRFVAAREWRDQPLTPESARLFAPARDWARALLQRRLERTLRRAEHLEDATTSERHALRIEVKKLRYAADAFASLFPEKLARRYLRRLSRLQDVLGHLNDVATTERLSEALLRRLGEEASVDEQRGAGFLLGWWTARAGLELEKLPARWRKLEHATPFWS